MQVAKPLIFIFLITSLVACDPQYAKITHEYGKKDVTIEVKGERLFNSDPWDVTLRVKAFDKFDEVVGFQYHNEALDEEEVSFNWHKENECLIKMTEEDGNQFTFKLTVKQEQIHLRKMS